MSRVYDVCMPRVNIYLPEELARRAREAGLNVSGLAQEAIERKLRVRDLQAWLDEVRANPIELLRPIAREEMEKIWDEVDEDWGRAADKWVDPEKYERELAEIEARE